MYQGDAFYTKTTILRLSGLCKLKGKYFFALLFLFEFILGCFKFFNFSVFLGVLFIIISCFFFKYFISILIAFLMFSNWV